MGTKKTHGELKELDVAKGASSIVDLGMEVSTADQVNDKATEAHLSNCRVETTRRS